MTRNLIYTRIKEILRRELNVPGNVISESAELAFDLGADSLDIVDIVISIEDTFHIDITNEEKDALHMVKDCIDIVERKYDI